MKGHYPKQTSGDTNQWVGTVFRTDIRRDLFVAKNKSVSIAGNHEINRFRRTLQRAAQAYSRETRHAPTASTVPLRLLSAQIQEKHRKLVEFRVKFFARRTRKLAAAAAVAGSSHPAAAAAGSRRTLAEVAEDRSLPIGIRTRAEDTQFASAANTD